MGPVTPNIKRPPSADTVSDPELFWRSKNVPEVLYHHAKFGEARTSQAVVGIKNLRFLSVFCLFVTSHNLVAVWGELSVFWEGKFHPRPIKDARNKRYRAGLNNSAPKFCHSILPHDKCI